MRRARLKPSGIPICYHLYNRVAGEPGFLPFGPAEKEQFVRLLHKVQRFFTVRILAYQIMSNHFHLLVYAPSEPPSGEEVARRYEAYYHGLRTLDPSDPRCREMGERMRDISWFMHAIQQQFTTWYNHTRPTRRRGALWAERFKHTLLGGSEAIWACWKYIEMNPVRAGMVDDPADYRFGSYAAWKARGRHPFSNNVQDILIPLLNDSHSFESPDHLLELMGRAFQSAGSHADPDANDACFTDHIHRRVRYWVDGLVIGSDIFVMDMIRRSKGMLRLKARRFTRLLNAPPDAPPLCAYKTLRAI